MSSTVGRVISSVGERGWDTGTESVSSGSLEGMLRGKVQAASSAKRLLVLYQYIRPRAIVHLAALFFQLLDVWMGAAVVWSRRCGNDRDAGA